MLRSLFLLTLTATMKTEEHGVFFKIEENSFLHDGDSIWDGEADSLLSCSQLCARNAACKSANFMADHGACSLLRQRQTRHAEKRSHRQGSFYLEKVDSASSISKSLGTSQSSAVPSCQVLLSESPLPSSGVYWINPDGGSQDNAFKAYCDMETDGGGWTLVWSYTFTNYNNFMDNSNAITPRPNWQVRPVVDVPISTTPPLNETDYNAMNFSQWKQLGRQVLIKSNINNWLICHPGTGSLVDWQGGSVSCQIVKRVTDTCKERPAPSTFALTSYGPVFSTTKLYYYFDGYTGNNWPTHDPCGENNENHVKNVVNPHGNIFIR